MSLDLSYMVVYCVHIRVKNAVKEIRRKLLDSDPTVVYYALLVLDSLMKNCASELHSEVLSSEFMGVMRSIITSSKVRWCFSSTQVKIEGREEGGEIVEKI